MTHDRIDPQPFSIVDIFISSQTAIDGLAEQGRHRMTDVAAGAKVEQLCATRLNQWNRLIEVTEGEETSIRTDLCPMEFQLDDTVKTDSQGLLTCFTPRGSPYSRIECKNCPYSTG